MKPRYYRKIEAIKESDLEKCRRIDEIWKELFALEYYHNCCRVVREAKKKEKK